MTLSLRFAAGSHTGLIREHNEDSGYAGPRLLAIADGMGGQAAGEVASSEVISTFVQLDDDIPGSDILTSLDTSVQRANSKLRTMVEEDPRLDGMGTTLTALLWTGQRLGLVHVGDSRAYLLRDGVLTQITQDHTWVQRLVDEGRITEEEATTHPQRSLLMRALGSADHIEADLSIREVRAGDRYLLCSDGLSGVVSAETLQETLAGFAAPQATVRELIELALRGGGPDNITCIVADVVDIGAQEGGALAQQLYDAPQIVGAVAESQTSSSGSTPQTPAARAAELGRPQSPPTGPPRVDAAPLLGAFGDPSPDDFADNSYPPERPRGRVIKRVALAVLVLALLGGATYAGYRWTQQQYYVAANGDHVAIYRGLSQDLGPLTLSSVKEDHPDVELRYLPDYQRSRLENAISARDLDDARGKVGALGEQAEACRLIAERDRAAEAAEETRESERSQPTQGAPDRTDTRGAPDRTDETASLPPLTAEQRELAGQCAR